MLLILKVIPHEPYRKPTSEPPNFGLDLLRNVVNILLEDTWIMEKSVRQYMGIIK